MRKRGIILLLVTMLLLSCSPKALWEAEEVVAQADSMRAAGQMYGIDAGDPLALAIQVPNPVTTGSIDIQVLSPNSVDEREDIDYTLELWSENSRMERTISSTISGEKDVVSMDANGLQNGMYLLLLKVDNKVRSTSKLIINR